VGERKITPKDLLICFGEVRKRGIQGEKLMDAISACVLQKAEFKTELKEKLKSDVRSEWEDTETLLADLKKTLKKLKTK